MTKRVSTLFQKSLSCRLLNSHSGKYNSISKYNNQVLTPRWGRRDLLNGLLEQGEACSPARPWWHPARACNPPAASRRQSRNRRPSPRRKRTRFCPSPSSASARTMAADEAPKLFDRFWSWSPFMFILFSGLCLCVFTVFLLFILLLFRGLCVVCVVCMVFLCLVLFQTKNKSYVFCF